MNAIWFHYLDQFKLDWWKKNASVNNVLVSQTFNLLQHAVTWICHHAVVFVITETIFITTCTFLKIYHLKFCCLILILPTSVCRRSRGWWTTRPNILPGWRRTSWSQWPAPFNNISSLCTHWCRNSFCHSISILYIFQWIFNLITRCTINALRSKGGGV